MGIKTSVLAIALLVGLGHGSAFGAEPTAKGKVTWTASFSEGVRQAKAQGKPLMVDFFATWCGPCKMMDQKTYTDAAVQSELANWISVRVDVDRDPRLSQQYKIKSIPTTVLFTADGKPISSTSGFMPPKEFISLLSKARETKK